MKKRSAKIVPTLLHEALITLIEARCTLSSPAAWTRGTFARDIDGNPTPDKLTPAGSYCFRGAMHHSVQSRASISSGVLAIPSIGSFSLDEVIQMASLFIVPHLPPMQEQFYSEASRMIAFNDYLATHDDIIRVLDRAIRDAKLAFDNELTANKDQSQ